MHGSVKEKRMSVQQTRNPELPEDDRPYTSDGTGYLPLRRQGSLIGWAKVDAEDLDRVAEFDWSLQESGLVGRRYWEGGRRHTVNLHRAVLGLDFGDEPQVRFVSADRLDCRRQNLRPSKAWAARMMYDTTTGWALADMVRTSHDADSA